MYAQSFTQLAVGCPCQRTPESDHNFRALKEEEIPSRVVHEIKISWVKRLNKVRTL